MTKFSSPLEVGARFTSGFAPRRKLFGKVAPHAGDDFAPRVPRTRPPILAVADGTVVATGLGALVGHSGLIVVLDHGIIGGDRTLTNYGHMSRIDVKRGQKVVAGQQLGLVGNTGNSTSEHLHIGVRFNGRYYSAKKWLATKGIVVGKTPPVVPGGAVSKPKPKPKPTSTSKHVKDVKTIQKRLKAMGYSIVVDGKDGPKTRGVIKEYQISQRSPYKLVSDGFWGNKSETHFNWTVALQKTANKWQSKFAKLKSDGHYGGNTVARIKDIQSKNKGKAYKGAVDGIPGRVFCKMLKISTHP